MARRLIICAVGTWQTEDARTPSNVCRIADLIAATGRDGKSQIVYYQPGVGTDPTRGVINRRHQFHDTRLSGFVKHAYHALAIDEQRRTFAPALWEEQADQPFTGTVEQVWFTGSHSDVGGDYADRALGDVSLCWMMERATDLELVVSAECELRPDHAGPQHGSRWLPHKWPIVREVAVRQREIVVGHRRSAHRSAIDRMNDVQGYGPGNLQRAIRGGLPVVEAVAVRRMAAKEPEA